MLISKRHISRKPKSTEFYDKDIAHTRWPHKFWSGNVGYVSRQQECYTLPLTSGVTVELVWSDRGNVVDDTPYTPRFCVLYLRLDTINLGRPRVFIPATFCLSYKNVKVVIFKDFWKKGGSIATNPVKVT